jgi:TolB-like protein
MLKMAEGGGRDQVPGTAPEVPDPLQAHPGNADVFVSYASQDATVAAAVVRTLEGAGVQCWIAPRDVLPGALYADEIVRAINEAKVVVLVLSEQAIVSSHVGKEIERASSKGRRIVALRTDSATLTRAFEYFLSESQWIDIGSKGIEAASAKLIDAVRRHLAPVSDTKQIGQPGRRTLEAKSAPRRRLWIAMAPATVLAIALAYFIVEKFWLPKHAVNERPIAVTPAVASAAAAISDRSVAVLPFVDMSEKKDQEYFSDGLSEELIDLLARVPGLAVPARTSSFYFKNMSTKIPDIAKQLGVSHILEGSVRKSGNRLRVAVQLVRADNGYHLWSATYDRELRDVFKMQDDIAGAVVSALKVTLLADSEPRSIMTANTEAYTLYLQARELFQRGTATDYQSAYEHLVRAVRLDPRFAAAWSEIARVRVRQYYLGEMPMAQAAPEAHDAIQKALHLDPELAEAHLTKGRVLYFFDWDWQGADTEMKRALLLDPSIGESYRWAAMTARTLGRFDEAQSLLREALARDPLEAFTYGTISGYFMQSGQWTEALKAGARAHDLMPHVWGENYIAEIALARGEPQAALAALSHVESPIEVSSLKTRAFRALGRNADADAALAELEKLAANDAPAEIARIYALRGDRDLAFKWLDRSYELRDVAAADIKGDPDFNNLKTDPRYAAFLRKMKLPQ